LFGSRRKQSPHALHSLTPALISDSTVPKEATKVQQKWDQNVQISVRIWRSAEEGGEGGWPPAVD